MQQTFALSSHRLGPFLTAPFLKGAECFRDAWSGKESISRRITSLVLGIGLLIPLVNIIICLAMKRFTRLAPADVKQSVVAILKRAVSQIDLQGICKDGEEIGESLLAVKLTVEKLTKEGKLYVKYPYQNHAFQAQVTRVSRQLSGYSKVASLWKRFLNTMEKHTTLIYPAGNHVRLDFSRQRKVLKNPKNAVKIKVFRKESILSKKELDQVMEIERESFSMTFDKKFYQNSVLNTSGATFLCAHEEKTQQIVGFLLERQGHIQVVARRANAACLGIGRKLFQGLANSYQNSGKFPSSLRLELRLGNIAAMKLYKRLGFTAIGISAAGYYQLPIEPAILMTCTVPKFLKSTSSV